MVIEGHHIWCSRVWEQRQTVGDAIVFRLAMKQVEVVVVMLCWDETAVEAGF
jgi:hypothetical protein